MSFISSSTFNNLIILLCLVIFFFLRGFLFSLPDLFYWWFKDLRKRDRNKFKLFGLTLFCGRQGSGKTTGLVWYLEKLRKRYPLVKIYTNFGYLYETAPLSSLNDLLNTDLYNGEFGTIFVFDELQNEFSSASSRDFPETVLSVVTQQRKQKILILGSSQVFTRVSKPLREQCFNVVDCFTFGGRYTRLKWYNADLYNDFVDHQSLDTKKKLTFKKKRKDCFVQTDYLRSCFKSYEIVKRLSRVGFVPKVADLSVNPVVNVGFKKR